MIILIKRKKQLNITNKKSCHIKKKKKKKVKNEKVKNEKTIIKFKLNFHYILKLILIKKFYNNFIL